MRAYKTGRHTLVTIGTLDFAVVSLLCAVFAEMSHLFTVPTSDSGWVARLVTFFAYMAFLATVATVVSPAGGAVLRKVSHCKLSE